MFEPLIKNLVRKLDNAAEAYLERQQMINLLAVPGTLLFLLLFWAFSGAGAFMLLLGLFVVAIEVGIAVGLFLLKDKYEDQVLEWVRAADAIEGRLTDDDLFGEWTEFLQSPCTDPELEQIRSLCQALPDQYPATEEGEYCGPEGIELMQECIVRLRVGIVSRGYDDFTVWWAARQEAKHGLGGPVHKTRKRKKKTKSTVKLGRATADEADAVMHMASMSGGILNRSDQERIDREAGKESVKAGKEERRDAKRASRVARKATKLAVKQEKKLRHRAAMMEAVEDEMVLYEDEDLEDSVPQHLSGPTQTPARPHVETDDEDPQQDEQESYHSQIPHHSPPPPPAPKRRRKRGLTEAAAIQEVMRSGLTAHHYDDAQVRLTEHLGRYPKPSEVVKALKSQFSKKSQKREKKQKVKTAGPRRKAQRPMATFRIDSGGDMQSHRRRRPASAVRTFARMVFVFGLIVGAPFAVWRIPRPETKPIMITGEVQHRILDHPPDMQHKLRTPFEELFGHKPVNLDGGERIYVNTEDYGLCWPESWDAIYEGRYSVIVTAEVRQLLFGGYGVARITSAERVDVPVATGTEYSLETPDIPEQWQPARRYHRPRFGR